MARNGWRKHGNAIYCSYSLLPRANLLFIRAETKCRPVYGFAAVIRAHACVFPHTQHMQHIHSCFLCVYVRLQLRKLACVILEMVFACGMAVRGWLPFPVCPASFFTLNIHVTAWCRCEAAALRPTTTAMPRNGLLRTAAAAVRCFVRVHVFLVLTATQKLRQLVCGLLPLRVRCVGRWRWAYLFSSGRARARKSSTLVFRCYFCCCIVVYIYVRIQIPICSIFCHHSVMLRIIIHEFIIHETCRRIRVRHVYVNRLNGVWRFFLHVFFFSRTCIRYYIPYYIHMLTCLCYGGNVCVSTDTGHAMRRRMLNYAPTRRARTNKF